jgi:lipopolysaccharide assembly outer membrane protein LptD (OstA)
MTRVKSWMKAILIVLALLALPGCGRPNLPKPEPEENETTAAPLSTRLENPTIKVSDPEGRWTFEARAEMGEAAGQEGPFRLSQATGEYRQRGQPPVFMAADRAVVDKQAERVELQGSVRIKGGGVLVEGERVVYDLKAAKVIASAGTKCTLTPGDAGREQSAVTAGGEEKP